MMTEKNLLYKYVHLDFSQIFSSNIFIPSPPLRRDEEHKKDPVSGSDSEQPLLRRPGRQPGDSEGKLLVQWQDTPGFGWGGLASTAVSSAYRVSKQEARSKLIWKN